MTTWRHLAIAWITALVTGGAAVLADGPYPPGPYSPAPYPPGSYPPGSYPPGSYPVPAGSPATASTTGPWTPGTVSLAPAEGVGPYGPAVVPDSRGFRPNVVCTPPERPGQSEWYTRVDYFHWNERLDGFDFVNESGALYTLGYAHRYGQERFRVELFGGEVHYSGYDQYRDGSLVPLAARTDYLGCKGEYELLLEPSWWSQGTFLLGLGNRFWVRGIRDGVDASNTLSPGYQETWWTFYPYVGVETRQPLGGLEWYTSSKIGVTPMAYNFAAGNYLPLFPRAGMMGQVELGVRGQRLGMAGYFEGLSWSRSGVVDGYLQPDSKMYTIGGKISYTF